VLPIERRKLKGTHVGVSGGEEELKRVPGKPLKKIKDPRRGNKEPWKRRGNTAWGNSPGVEDVGSKGAKKLWYYRVKLRGPTLNL